MTDEIPAEPTGTSGPPPIGTHSSTLVEQILEYRFLGELTAELLRRGRLFEVLHGAFDHHGHDVVIEVDGIVRHIQLKGMISGGKRRDVAVNRRLCNKPSGCVVWMTYDPLTYAISQMRWLGSAPGQPLGDLGDRVARHSKGNADGKKTARPLHRIVPAGRFRTVRDIAELADLLFGAEQDRRFDMLLGQLRIASADVGEADWVRRVRHGDFTAIPADLGWEESVPFAILVDGYRLADELGTSDPMRLAEANLDFAQTHGHWHGDTVDLWIALFLEYRRWRFSSPFEPGPDMERLLDRLVAQLVSALREIGRWDAVAGL